MVDPKLIFRIRRIKVERARKGAGIDASDRDMIAGSVAIHSHRRSGYVKDRDLLTAAAINEVDRAGGMADLGERMVAGREFGVGSGSGKGIGKANADRNGRL